MTAALLILRFILMIAYMTTLGTFLAAHSDGDTHASVFFGVTTILLLFIRQDLIRELDIRTNKG